MSDINLIIKATDNASAVLNRINKNVDKLDKNGRRASKAMGGMGAALKTVAVAAAAIGLGKLVSSTVQTIAKFESLRASLKTVTGSVDGARVAFARIQEFTAKTPFQLDEVTESFIILQRFGIDTSIKSLNAFGNIAAANGKSMSQLSEAVADALTGEFERLKEFGIKVKRENDKFVMSMGETEMAVVDSAGALVAELKKLGEEGGQFASGLADQSATLGGKFSNLQDNISQFMAAIGAGGLNSVLKDILDSFNLLGPSAVEVGRVIGAGLGAAIKTVIIRFQVFANAVSKIFGAVASVAVDLLMNIKKTFSNLKNMLGLDDVMEKFSSAFTEMGRIAKVIVNFIVNTFRALYEQGFKIFTKLPGVFKDVFLGIGTLGQDFGNRMINQFTNIGKAMKLAIEAPFTDVTFKDALNMATKNAFEGFNIGESFKLDTDIFLSKEDIKRIFAFDNIDAAKKFILGVSEDVMRELSILGIELSAFKPGQGFATFMEEYNRLIAEGEAEADAIAEAIAKHNAEQKKQNNTTNEGNKNKKKEITLLDKQIKAYDELVAKITKKSEADLINADLIERTHQAYANGTFTLAQYSEALTQLGSDHETLELRALRTAQTIKQGFQNMAGQVTDVFFNMFTGVTSAFQGLQQIARMVFEMVAKAIIQAFIVKPIIGALTGGMGIPFFANGGMIPSGQAAIVGERGPEIITGSAGGTRVFSNTESRNMMNSGRDDDSPLTVNFNLTAVDTQTGVQFLMENKSTITGMIQTAYNQRGVRGPLG